MSAFDAGSLVFKLQTLGAQIFKQDQADAKDAVEKTGKAAQTAKGQVDGLGTATDETGKKAKSAKAPLDEQAKATEEVGKKSKKSSEEQEKQRQATEQQISAAKQLSAALLIAGTAVAALVTLSIAKSTEFDAAMSNVRAATMATTAEQQKLGEAALDAGADTAFSAREAADAEEELAKAGLSVAEIVGGSLNGALALAAAGQLQVARSAEIMATTLKQYSLEGKDAGHVSDLLAAGAGKAQGSVDDLAQALQYVGPVAAGLGISLEETTGTLALFASQGQLGERAGTGLRGVLMSLTSPSALAAKTMKEYNVEIFDGNGKMKSLAAISQQLKGAFGGLTEAERSAALGRIFGNEQITAARVLYEGGAKAVNEWTDAVDESGYAARQAAMRQDNLAGDIEKLGGAFDTALIKTGSAANDVLRSMVQGITELIDMYGEAPEPIQATATVLGVATAAVLLFAGGAVGARAKFLELKLALDQTTTSMGKTALIGGAVGLALTGIITIVAGLAAQQTEARQKAQAYADTLEDGTNRITKATRDMVKENLAASGSFLWFNQPSAFDKAESLGLSLERVTDAAMGNVDALKELKAAQEEYQAAYDADKKAGDTSAVDDARLQNINAIIDAVKGENASIEESIRIAEQKQQADQGSTDTSESAADAYIAEADSVEDLNSKLTTLIDTINEANGVGQDAVTTNADYQETLLKVNEQIANIQGGVEGFGRGLDLTTQAGIDNSNMLVQMAKDSQDAAEAQLNLDGNTGNYLARLQDGRQKLIDSAIAMGTSEDAAIALADSIYKIPSQKEIEILAETAAAQNKVDTFVTLNNGRRVKVFVDAETGNQSFQVGSKTVSAYANGAVIPRVSFNAAGNVYRSENHVAQIARAGDVRVWAEPETGGETYVPHALSKRARAEAIMAETASIFGGTYIPGGARAFAEGSSPAPTADVLSQFPSSLTLVVGEREFTAFVRDEAGGVQRSASTPFRRGGRRT
ncbi:phage tail tape measure protein [Microbacterium sp. STF-2]|uniref:phage tail tape measure protein n=1 Tax=Microbacterium sp. STF-2 TaxID=3031132 RepID=UPI002AFF31FB|nr:phage tail tape measure protein [Microbacterium sp. STF-2]MEA1264253.1 phage tail tape measure protein [Microbacterium sp. STF-2]